MPVDTSQFEQAKARIQNWVREIAALSRTNVPIADYFGQFLERVVRCVDAHGGAIWLLGNQEFQLLCEIRIDDIEFKTNPAQRSGILRSLKDVVENKRSLVVSALGPDVFPHSVTSAPGAPLDESAIANQTSYPLFYVPLMVDQQAVGVLHIWQKPHRDPKANQDFITFLTSVSAYAESYLKSRRITELARELQQQQKLIAFSSALAGQFDETQIGVLATNHVREILGCDRCVLVSKRGENWNVASVSGVAQPQKKSQLVKVLTALGESIPDGETKLFVRGDATRTSPEADTYFSESNLDSVIAIPLKDKSGQRLGTFLAESAAKTPWPDALQRTATWVTEPITSALSASREYHDLPLLPVMKTAQKTKRAFLGPKRNRTLAMVGVPLGALLILAVMPWKLKIEGDCTLLPTARAVAPCEIEGRVAQVLVREGDDVREGQPLARLDDAKIRLDLAVARQEQARWETEADRQRVAGDEGQRRVSELQAQLAARQVAKLEHDLALCEIRSPIDGRVVTKDLHLRVGQVLQTGEVFTEIARLDRWECVINVRESDVSQIDDRLRAGHEVPVRFILYSHTTDEKQGVVRGLSKVSQLSTASERHNVFQVTADVAPDPMLARELKPGYTGRAKLDAGWHMASYVFTRRFLNFLRVEWLF